MNLYIVTGTTRGLGKALVDLLADDPGNEIVCLSRGSDGPPRTRSYTADLSIPSAIPGVMQRAFADCREARYDRAVLINNAGVVTPVGPLTRCPPAQLENNFNVNLLAPVLLMREFIAPARRLSATQLVVNISSGAARRAVSGWSAYCAAKAGLEMVSRVAALEAGARGLVICSLAPGVIDTGMQAQIRETTQDRFPDVERFRAMKDEGALKSAREAAASIIRHINADAFANGGVHDLREM